MLTGAPPGDNPVNLKVLEVFDILNWLKMKLLMLIIKNH